MTYRRLGSSGLVVSTVGLGCNNFGRRIGLDATRAVVDAAIEEGITFFDTADVYGDSELLLGEVLAGGGRGGGVSAEGWGGGASAPPGEGGGGGGPPRPAGAGARGRGRPPPHAPPP